MQGKPKVRPKLVEMAKETKSWDMDTEVITAINEIRTKDRKRPYCSTITTKLGKKKITCTSNEVDDALRRLVQRKRIENRGEDGEDSYFVLDISEFGLNYQLKRIPMIKQMIRLQLKLSSTLHYQNFYH